MMSDRPEGLYTLIDGDPMLLGCRCAPPNWAYVPTYYTRIFRHDNEVLLHHHWLPRENFTDAWLGTCKVLREERPGKLSLRWWPGNERLKGSVLFNLSQEQAEDWIVPRYYELHTGQCTYGQDGLTLTTGSSVLAWHPTADYVGGLIAEAVFTIHGEGAAGLLFGGVESEDPNAVEGAACLCGTRGMVELGIVKRGLCCPSFLPENQIPWPIKAGQAIHMKVLLRGEFIEVYIDDRLVHCYGFSTCVTHNIGFFTECEELTVHSLKAWAFDL